MATFVENKEIFEKLEKYCIVPLMNNIIEATQNYIDTYNFGLEFFGNTIGEYLLALIIFIGLSIVFKLVQWIVLRKLAVLAEKTETDIDDTFIRIVKSLRPGFYIFVAFFFASQSLVFTSIGTK